MSEDHSEPAGNRDRNWLVPVAAVVAIQLGLWWILYIRGYAYPPMITAYGATALAAMVVVLCFRLAIEWFNRRRHPHPLRTIFADLRASPRQVLAIILGIQLLAVSSSAFGALKAAMPKVAPFWLDAPLARWERTLFTVDPWQISHWLFGWATPAIDRLYTTFIASHLLSAIAVLTLRPSALKTNALVSLALIWLLLGTAGAYLMSSAGPIFYDRAFGGDRFAEMMAALRSAPIATQTADLLWYFHQYDRPVIANGISAMPSMHVGLTMWLALILGRTRFAALGWLYYALIWLGSIHLGWHYAADGLVASLGVLVIWKATPGLVHMMCRAGPLRHHSGHSDA